jgi:hypothetical protein
MMKSQTVSTVVVIAPPVGMRKWSGTIAVRRIVPR